MLVRDIMTASPTVVTRDETVTQAAYKMREGDCGMLPVVAPRGDERRLVGVITDRDITIRHVAAGHDSSCAVGAHMTSESLAMVRPDEPVDRAIEVMKRARVRRLPVVDADGHLVGILAQADIARDLGPRQPQDIEGLLEVISEPSHLPAA